MEPNTSSQGAWGKGFWVAFAAQAAKCLFWCVSEAQHAAGSYGVYHSDRKEEDGGI